jgi:hypothetical protein
MMNPSLLQELARERHRDLINDATHSHHRMHRELRGLDASEVVFRFGRPAQVIDARARAQARLRVTSAALDPS